MGAVREVVVTEGRQYEDAELALLRSDYTPAQQAAAKATGKSESTIHRAAKCGKELGDDELLPEVGSCLDNGKELDALARIEAAQGASLAQFTL